MKRYFDVSFRPFFVLTGIATALGALNAIKPEWTADKIERIPFDQNYTIVLQHWGSCSELVGAFMLVAAFNSAWRDPILIFSACEKAFFVCLEMANVTHPYARGLRARAAMDATIVLYTVAYFIVCEFRKPFRAE